MTNGYVIYKEVGDGRNKTQYYFTGFQNQAKPEWDRLLSEAKLYKRIQGAKQIAHAMQGKVLAV